MSESSNLSLRLLEPETDFDLFKLSYSWRTPKRHISGPRMPFQTFSEPDPSHIAVGLFNGELLAVYLLCEVEPAVFEAHFTSRKGVSRETLLLGARQVMNDVLENGAAQIDAWIVKENRALRRFVEELGFACVETETFSLQEPIESSSIQTRNQRGQQVFVKYAKRA